MPTTPAKETAFSIDRANIVIKLGGGVVEIKGPDQLRIEQRINEHATIFFKEPVKGNKEQYLKMIEKQTAILVYPASSASHALHSSVPRYLFQGLATKIELYHASDGVDYVEVYGISYTILLDDLRRKRSFQNQKLKLRQVIDQILHDYPGAIGTMDNTYNKDQDKFILQYNETDWELLKRLASQYANTVLIPNPVADKVMFAFGVQEVDPKTLDEHCQLNYTVSKTMDGSEAALKLDRHRFSQEMDDNDIFYYHFPDTNHYYKLGDKVLFNRKVLYVCQSTWELKGNVLKNSYIMTTSNGLKYPKLYNQQIVGLALTGKVKEVTNTKVKLELEIDKGGKVFTKEEACLFPYATPYTGGGKSGWYFMPELEDEVQLHFPSEREEQGFVIHSVRTKQTSRTDDDQVKFLRTKDGKELHFGPDELVISGKDNGVYIRLKDNEGITVYSDSNITLDATGNILIAANDTVNITAGAQLDLIRKNCNIRLNGLTSLYGTKVKDVPVTGAEAKKLAKASALVGVEVPGGVSTGESTEKEDMNHCPRHKEFLAELKKFPKSYHAKLRALHDKHHYWSFKAFDAKMSLSQFVDRQYSLCNPVPKIDNSKYKKYREARGAVVNKKIKEIQNSKCIYLIKENNKLVKKKAEDLSWQQIKQFVLTDGNFFLCNKEGIEYFGSPTNFLEEESIFQFLELSFNDAVQSKDGLKSMMQSTYFDKKIDSYVNWFWNACSKSGINPYFLVAKALIEGGAKDRNSTNVLLTGFKNPNDRNDTKTYYNFFGYGANDGVALHAGKVAAVKLEWNSEKACIDGGAKAIGGKYVAGGARYNLYIEVQPTRLHLGIYSSIRGKYS